MIKLRWMWSIIYQYYHQRQDNIDDVDDNDGGFVTTQMYANTLQDEEDPDMPAQEVKMLFQIFYNLRNFMLFI